MADKEEFKLTTGRGGGSGVHSYRYASRHSHTVHVSHMPENFMQIRITFSSDGEQAIPIIKLHDTDAKLLRIALNAMAEDLKWEDV